MKIYFADSTKYSNFDNYYKDILQVISPMLHLWEGYLWHRVILLSFFFLDTVFFSLWEI